jgi:uroporphyrinogen-III decarboxylase
MTGREKVEAALATTGSPQLPVVIPYIGIYARDRWADLTSCPWWYMHDPDVDHQLAWIREAQRTLGVDWVEVYTWYSVEERAALSVEVTAGDPHLVDARTGSRRRLSPPTVGGWPSEGVASHRPENPPTTAEELDACVPVAAPESIESLAHDGRADLAHAVTHELPDLYPLAFCGTPLWNCYYIWGFEGLMEMIALRPDLVERAVELCLERNVQLAREAAVLGAHGIWVEECMTDLIGPAAFERLNVPSAKRLIDEIRALGLQSIYYWCGDSAGKLDMILSCGADAVALEESKKGFTIDIDEVADRAQGLCAVLGNLDAIGILQDGTDDQLRAAIERQLRAEDRLGGRFVMSLGSPVTPGTPPARVKRYCELARAL